MATFEQNLKEIRGGVYGRDVREAIAEGLEQANKKDILDVSKVELTGDIIGTGVRNDVGDIVVETTNWVDRYKLCSFETLYTYVDNITIENFTTQFADVVNLDKRMVSDITIIQTNTDNTFINYAKIIVAFFEGEIKSVNKIIDVGEAISNITFNGSTLSIDVKKIWFTRFSRIDSYLSPIY